MLWGARFSCHGSAAEEEVNEDYSQGKLHGKNKRISSWSAGVLEPVLSPGVRRSLGPLVFPKAAIYTHPINCSFVKTMKGLMALYNWQREK